MLITMNFCCFSIFRHFTIVGATSDCAQCTRLFMKMWNFPQISSLQNLQATFVPLHLLYSSSSHLQKQILGNIPSYHISLQFGTIFQLM